MLKIRLIDSTCRDGSHAIRHQFTKQNICDYAKRTEKAGIDTLICGHGNGLSCSTYQVGFSLLSDKQMLETARKELRKTKLGAFMIPGFATIKQDLQPAIDIGIQVIMVACHITESNITHQHIEYAKSKGLEAIGVLMMAHTVDKFKLLEQAQLMQSYGADGVLIMDSAGAILPGEAISKVSYLSSCLDIPLGFHAHNNLGMAVATSLSAVKAGAKFLDCTSRGLGAGAGNCPLEVMVAVLHKLGYETGLDLYKLMDNSDLIKKIMDEHHHIQEISMTSLASGLAGIFSGFKDHVLRAAKEYKVDPRDIFFRLGELKAVAGQEDLIVTVAKELSEHK